LENKAQSLVALACLVKRHTFKENKWKAYALSGLASPWFEKLSTLYIRNEAIPVKIEVPLSYSSEFFIHFADDYKPEEKAQLFVERSSFPALSEGEFYICDLIGVPISSELGLFRVQGFFENGDPSSELTTLSLQLESLDKDTPISVEVPLGVLKRKENSWFIEDISLWVEVSTKSSKEEHDE
jgi:hypothetical protein